MYYVVYSFGDVCKQTCIICVQSEFAFVERVAPKIECQWYSRFKRKFKITKMGKNSGILEQISFDKLNKI